MASWKIDAANEDVNKYFFEFDEFSAIKEGNVCIVLGRKGSGKTAICEFLHTRRAEGKRSVRLSFKDFPFDQLYTVASDPRAKNSQYINVWKLIILSTVCWLMSRDPNVDFKTRQLLKSHFADDPTRALSTTIARWTSENLTLPDFSRPEIGGRIEKSGSIAGLSLGERVGRLERFIERAGPKSSYYLLFDDLHEDYRGEENDSEYFLVLTGLLSAVTSLRTTFRRQPRQIIPIAFVRDDIFARVDIQTKIIGWMSRKPFIGILSACAN
ncbi:MAG TPA: hypothetical protein VH684_05330 [Xanthobacteraceae bacterium]|jgi:hypothetical protein